MGGLQHNLEEASKAESSAEPCGFGLNSSRRLRATWQEAWFPPSVLGPVIVCKEKQKVQSEEC